MRRRARAIDRVRYAEWNKSAPDKNKMYSKYFYTFSLIFCYGDTSQKILICRTHPDEQHVLDRFQIQTEMRFTDSCDLHNNGDVKAPQPAKVM
jgi:hypothetical protein